MALSNRDRVNAGFEILATVLDEYLTKTVQVDEQSTWIDILELVDIQKGRRSDNYARLDPQCSLRFITESVTGKFKQGWYPLSRDLTRADEALASELRQTRNAWAHNSTFSPDDTYRALDTMERLVRAMGNKPAAEQLLDRKNAARVIQDRKASALSEQELLVSVGGDSLPPWRDLVVPHPDVANGTFNPSGFAADLYTVANPLQVSDTERVSSGAEYTDPQQFFERTYLTEGLRDLLNKALRRLNGDATASPVMNLQTNFGGGKTHSMLAVWHLFGGINPTALPQDMQELVDAHTVPTSVRRVALVGTNLSASGGMTMADGTTVNTVWGHLAWQLGGKEGYEIVKEDDLNATNPGAKLRTLLSKFGPSLILIDEWVAYARQLVSNSTLAGGTLSTQQSFAQALGEAATATPNSMLLVSIPASAEMQPGSYIDEDIDDEEVGGANGREALIALLQVINRQAEQWRPAGATESFEIVRRRIFEEFPDDSQGKIKAVAEVMRLFYGKNKERFPHDASRSDYKTKIERCYPIHPELFDRLYEDWASLPRFQRTRGVLRLMSIIVHQVWKSPDTAPFIMPSSVPLANSNVANELAQYLDDDWKSVIAVDVDGPIPHGIDGDNPLFGKRHIAARLARSVFLGSAPRARKSGMEERYVNLGTAIPGDKLGNFHTALSALANKSSHFYESDGRYWFDTSANITSEVRQREESFPADTIFEEIENRLNKDAREWRRNSTSPISIVVSPSTGADVLDSEDARLVVVAPIHTEGSSGSAEDYVIRTTSSIGEQHTRTYKNTVVFLAADSRRISELTDSVRKFLAWSSVRDSIEELDLTASQSAQAKTNVDKWNDAVEARLSDAYQWLLIPIEASEIDKHKQVFVGVEKQKVTSGQGVIGRAVDKLHTASKVQQEQAARVLELNINNHLGRIWSDPGYISLGELWNMHTKYLYMPRLANRDVLEAGLRSSGVGEIPVNGYPFAFADGLEKGSTFVNLRWELGNHMGRLPDSLLLVNSSLAQAQFDVEREKHVKLPLDADSERTQPRISPTTVEPSGDAEDTLVTTYYGTFDLPIESAPALFMRIDDEILSHYRGLARGGARVTIQLDVKAVVDDGISESIQSMTRDSTEELPGCSADFE